MEWKKIKVLPVNHRGFLRDLFETFVESRQAVISALIANLRHVQVGLHQQFACITNLDLINILGKGLFGIFFKVVTECRGRHMHK